MMLLKTVSTMTSECFFVRSETRETSATASAFVMLPVVIGFLASLGCHVRRATCDSATCLRAHVRRLHVRRATCQRLHVGTCAPGTVARRTWHVSHCWCLK